MEYSKTLQNYIKEKNRILHDVEYRKNIIVRNNLLKNAKTESEKISVIKSIQEEMNRRGPEIEPTINTKTKRRNRVFTRTEGRFHVKQ